MLFYFSYQPRDGFEKRIIVKACDKSQAEVRARYVVMQSGFAERAHTIKHAAA